MDPSDAFSVNLFKWDPRGTLTPPNRLFEAVAAAAAAAAVPPTAAAFGVRPPPGVAAGGGRELVGLEELFQAYGIRYYTAAKIAELGFTVSTLVDMKEEELDDMMNSLSQIFRWELLVGERYGIKAAVRAERRRLEDEESRRRHLLVADTAAAHHALDALSQEGPSEERVQQAEKEAVGSGSCGGAMGTWEMIAAAPPLHGNLHHYQRKNQQRQQQQQQRRKMRGGVMHNSKERVGNNNMNNISSATTTNEDDEEENEEMEEQEIMIDGGGMSCGSERQREHPFIVTEPGEVARGKKNGLDYLFHLYELCRDFLIQVQNIAKERGEKCPTKVTNQVFRYAKKAGATYINKPKMRHYVHCYALHCLDEETSNTLRRAFKERGENVGAWRQACYKPLVAIAARQGWDIDAIFNAHPRLSIWYVPTKLRQLCHAERSTCAAVASGSLSASAPLTSHQLSTF
ncbi:hypothetical protein Ancab_035500 [Ancistrocladus abbreviatus]